MLLLQPKITEQKVGVFRFKTGMFKQKIGTFQLETKTVRQETATFWFLARTVRGYLRSFLSDVARVGAKRSGKLISVHPIVELLNASPPREGDETFFVERLGFSA